MALARWSGVVQDAAGNAISGAMVEVRREQTGGLAPIFSDRDGAVALPNPFVADEAMIGFHAAGGCYRITATVGDFVAEWRQVPIGTMQEQDAEAIQGVIRAADMPFYVAGLPERNPIQNGDQLLGAVYQGAELGWVAYRMPFERLQTWRPVSKASYPAGTLEVSRTDLGNFRLMRIRGMLLPNAQAPLGLRLTQNGGVSWLQGATDYRRVGGAVVGNNAPTTQSGAASYYYLNTAENCSPNTLIEFDLTIDNAIGGTSIAMQAKSLHTGTSTGSLISSDTRCQTSFGGTVGGVQLTMPGASFLGRVLIEGCEF